MRTEAHASSTCMLSSVVCLPSQACTLATASAASSAQGSQNTQVTCCCCRRRYPRFKSNWPAKTQAQETPQAPGHKLHKHHAANSSGSGSKLLRLLRQQAPQAPRRKLFKHQAANSLACGRQLCIGVCACPFPPCRPYDKPLHPPPPHAAGLHTGNCVSGLVGTRLPKYSVFGTSVLCFGRAGLQGWAGLGLVCRA